MNIFKQEEDFLTIFWQPRIQSAVSGCHHLADEHEVCFCAECGIGGKSVGFTSGICCH